MNFVLIEEKAFDLLRDALFKLRDKTQNLTRRLSGHGPADWLDSNDIALALGISKRSLHYYRNAGVIPHSMIGNKVYYPAGKLRLLLESGTVKPKTQKAWTE